MTLILGIETSCDETAVAVVEDGIRVLSNTIATQHDLHARYGGVVPEIASRAHLEKILPTITQSLHDADISLSDLHAIAVGNRPGLIGSLLVGVSAAKALAWAIQKPLLGVDHVHAHLYSPFLSSVSSETPSTWANPSSSPLQLSNAFPALGLVVSGGHTSLYQLSSPLHIQLLGKTIDDAVGEAYDKAAAILGLPHPGGPNLDHLAQSPSANPSRFELPRSLLAKDSLDFTFSGLKTALLYKVRGFPQGRGPSATFIKSHHDLSDQDRTDLAACFQHTAIDILLTKLRRALQFMQEQNTPARSILVGGGVSANSLLRMRIAQLAQKHHLLLGLPPMPYCLDNAAMIAGLAYTKLSLDHQDDLFLPAIATVAR